MRNIDRRQGHPLIMKMFMLLMSRENVVKPPSLIFLLILTFLFKTASFPVKFTF